MAKDRKARSESRITVIALGNLIAALVDTMREMEVPNHAVHRFLNEVERMNRLTLYGVPAMVMDDIVAVVRTTVPGND